ncbi:phosphoserine phosphatase [Angustibacter aerolatus]|uniref:phosphoserine phosphatase n=1 Tax=Angustibacter aerolatus TaxID=1162965 RepID=A0ABQ6J9V1_9ACTN|nr:phosphoserine phosphatase SerB [Angustibacter aerolatus]GMA84943.1 phosphoserine phosphatase [Angustibacter aerolatus]
MTLSGDDRPGVTSALFTALAGTPATVLDVEQVVVRGHLTLAVLLATDGDDRVRAAALDVAEEPRHEGALQARHRRGPRPCGGRLHVTLLGAPLTPAAVAAVARQVAAQGANIDRIRRISRWPVTTVEVDVSGGDVPSLRRAVATEAGHLGVDVAVSPPAWPAAAAASSSWTSTPRSSRTRSSSLLAAHAGREAEVAAVTERAMRGELDFAQSLHERVAALAGLDVAVLDDVRAAVRLTPGARTLVRTLKRLGFTVALVSGGFLEVVQPLADLLHVDHAHANRLEVRDGRLTGRVLGDVVDRAGKAAALRRFAEAEGLPLSRTVAIGDGANDLDMLDAAGLGIAFNAKPVVREQADASVTVPFLDAVLYLLGIPREEVEEADAADGLDPADSLP